MKSLTSLWCTLAAEAAEACGTTSEKDETTVLSRSKTEGLSFLTITLPGYAKDFERSLDIGQVEDDLFLPFRKVRGGLPAFLRGFLLLVFDESGALLDSPDHDAIRIIRQLTLMFSKIEAPCANKRIYDSISGYVECDVGIQPISGDLSRFEAVSYQLFGRLFLGISQKLLDRSLDARHGPGVTADGLLGNQKFTNGLWTERLERSFPAMDYLFVNDRFYDSLSLTYLPPEREIPVRVITVPKTMKTPRVIAIEPTHMQYAQQALMRELYEGVDRDFLLRRAIGFQDQEPNQLLALEGSRTGSLATLDLSEASDRVSMQLVDSLTKNVPVFNRAVFDCRSTTAELPSGEVITLQKFASMGSALTFPLEAMVFLAITVEAMLAESHLVPSRANCLSMIRSVRIFGDDIIVPTEAVSAVVDRLEAYGLKVNRRKSFWTGKFRESCGKEYYDGTDVSVGKLRHFFPSKRQDVAGVNAVVVLRNFLYKGGYWKTARYLDDIIRNFIKFPCVAETSPVLGRFSFLGYESKKVCEELHTPLVKGVSIFSQSPVNSIDDHSALMKCLTSGFNPDSEHLIRSGRPRSAYLKTGWYRPY